MLSHVYGSFRTLAIVLQDTGKPTLFKRCISTCIGLFRGGYSAFRGAMWVIIVCFRVFIEWAIVL